MKLGTEAAWLGPDMADSIEWIYELSAQEKREVRSALEAFEASGQSHLEADRSHFPLPTLGPRLAQMAANIDGGRGFFVLRGLPVDDLSEERVRSVFWGLGLYSGIAIPQTEKTELITDVRDLSDCRTTRGYLSTIALDFHTDSCDLALLLCRRKAKRGGASRLASSVAIHDYMVDHHPELLETLYQPLPVLRLAHDPERDCPWTMLPVFGARDGHFVSTFLPKRTFRAADQPGSPGLTELQRFAIETVSALAADPRFYLDMNLEVGDVQFIINHQIYHSRTDFEDYPEHDRKRHMLRMWLSTPVGRPLPEEWLDAYSSVDPASIRGGQPRWLYPSQLAEYYEKSTTGLGMKNTAPAL